MEGGRERVRPPGGAVFVPPAEWGAGTGGVFTNVADLRQSARDSYSYVVSLAL